MLLEERNINFNNALSILRLVETSIKSGDYTLDLVKVKKVDSSSIAIFLACVRLSQKQGQCFKLINSPVFFGKLVNLYGLKKLFE